MADSIIQILFEGIDFMDARSNKTNQKIIMQIRFIWIKKYRIASFGFIKHEK